MKKTIVLMAIIAVIAGCGSNESKPEPAGMEAKPSTTDNASTDLTKNPDYVKGLDLIAKSDCFGCHKVADPSTGPAYMAVANKYAGQPGIIDTLAQKIIKGGTGNWGTVPMTPHPQISEDDAKAMVKYIMTLKQ